MIAKFKIFLSFVVMLVFLTASDSYAGNWVDDWLANVQAQTNVLGQGSFMGQKRGYVYGGNITARFPVRNDYFVTASPPKFKMGCGGIDMFLGGFSYLNIDKLGQKAQRIISSAPFLAIDIALKQVAPQISETMKSIEQISNKLNSL